MIDKIYKIGLLLLGIVFSILFYQHNQSNRYQLKYEEDYVIVFDTNSGQLHFWAANKDNKNSNWSLVDPVHGGIKEIPFRK